MNNYHSHCSPAFETRGSQRSQFGIYFGVRCLWTYFEKNSTYSVGFIPPPPPGGGALMVIGGGGRVADPFPKIAHPNPGRLPGTPRPKLLVRRTMGGGTMNLNGNETNIRRFGGGGPREGRMMPPPPCGPEGSRGERRGGTRGMIRPVAGGG